MINRRVLSRSVARSLSGLAHFEKENAKKHQFLSISLHANSPRSHKSVNFAAVNRKILQVQQVPRKLVRRLKALKKTVAAAESCSAGLAADLIAGIPGASRVLWGSFVSYTPEAKYRMLGVSEECLNLYGAVSRETACAMARGALEHSGADFSFSITGLAGPGGDETGMPAGIVWIAIMRRGENPEPALFHFKGSRNRVRLKAAEKALEILLKKIT